ncbi:MAG: FHA domain-containing protein [Prevotella sp.]|nr:FHA domain-containing protein [Prevotella sp.]
MNIREITIGRSKTCDIYLDARCIYASKNHGTIYMDGTQMMFRDNSTNGTMINNIMVRKRAVPIRYGDSIMIAGQYPLNWSQINSFFPDIQQDARRNIGSSVAVPYTPDPPANNVVYTPAPAVNSGAGTTEVRLNGWNWGAFLFGGWWGLFNGCWWIFLVNIILGLLSLIPFAVAIFGPVQIIWSIICGVKGDQWAWENKEWYSAESFRSTQDTWNKVAVIFLVIGIVFGLIGVLSFFAMMSGSL